MNTDRKRGNRHANNSEEGWSLAGKNRSFPFSVQSDKLKAKPVRFY